MEYDKMIVGNNCFCPVCDVYFDAHGLDPQDDQRITWLRAIGIHAGESHGSQRARIKYLQGKYPAKVPRYRYNNCIEKLLRKHLEYLRYNYIGRDHIVKASPDGYLTHPVALRLKLLE